MQYPTQTRGGARLQWIYPRWVSVWSFVERIRPASACCANSGQVFWMSRLWDMPLTTFLCSTVIWIFHDKFSNKVTLRWIKITRMHLYVAHSLLGLKCTYRHDLHESISDCFCVFVALIRCFILKGFPEVTRWVAGACCGASVTMVVAQNRGSGLPRTSRPTKRPV